MTLATLVFTVSLIAPFTQAGTAQNTPKPAVDPSFEGCLAKGSAEGTFVLQSARPVTGNVVGTNLRFRLVADTKDVVLMPHLNHVVRVTGPVVGTIPTTASNVAEADLPQVRVKALSMISSECIVPR